MYDDIRFLSSRAQIKKCLYIPYSITKLDQILKPSRLKTNTLIKPYCSNKIVTLKGLEVQI